MFDEFKSGDKIAEEKFRATLPDDGTVIHYTVTLEKSGSFAYGNQTCVTVHDDYPGTWDNHYDTRYTKECSTVEGFRAWAFDFLKKSLRPDALIERETPAPKVKEDGKEYGVHYRSGDLAREYVGGHFSTLEDAQKAAARHRKTGSKDVYIVVRDVTPWKRHRSKTK